MTKIRTLFNRQSLEKGQSFVEMGISFVFFMFFIMGMLDLGRLYFQFVALEDAAGEAALYLALNSDCPAASGEPECPALFNDANFPADLKPDEAPDCPSRCDGQNNARARADAASSLIDLEGNPNAKLTFTYIKATDDSGPMVRVDLEYPFELLTPVISDIVGADTVKLTASASQVLMSTGE